MSNAIELSIAVSVEWSFQKNYIRKKTHITGYIRPFKYFRKTEKRRYRSIFVKNGIVIFFLKRGNTLASFNLSGKIPVLSDWFIMSAKGDERESLMPFISCIERLSWPTPDFRAKLENILLMSAAVIWVKVTVCGTGFKR